MGIAGDIGDAVFGVSAQRLAVREQVRERNQDLIEKGFNPDDMSIRPGSQAAVNQGNANIESQKIQALQQQLAQAQSGNATKDSDAALSDFAKTGDASNINKALTSNPQLAQAWGAKGVQNVSNIDYSHDQNLLANAGITPTMYDTPEKQSTLDKNLFKVYNGKDYSIGTAQGTLAETGAINRPGNSALIDSVHSNHQEMKDLLHGPKVDPTTAVGHKYEDIINTASDEYNIPPNVLSSMIHQESSGNDNAKGPVLKDGERSNGLMGLKDSTAKELGVTNMYDPRQNIYAGAKYLRQMLDKYQGNMTMALAAYNAGPGAVDKWGGVPPYGETQNYVAKISANLDQAGSYTGHSADSYGQSLQNHYQTANPQDTIDKINAYQAAGADAAAGLTVTQKDQQVQGAVAKDKSDVLKNQETMINDQVQQVQKDRQLNIDQQNANIAQDKLKNDSVTSEQKNIKAGNEGLDSVVSAFGGADKFYTTDFSKPDNYRKAIGPVQDFESLTGRKLTADQEKQISDLRGTINLAKTATGLTDSTAGPLADALHNATKLMSNDTVGVKERAAYATIRNAALHAFAGATLSTGELKEFNAAVGSLGEKSGPVLEQLSVFLDQQKSNLDSIASNMDPRVAKVRLGADQSKLNNIQANLGSLLDNINGMYGGKPIQANVKGVTSSTPNPSDIAPFGGNP